MSCKPKKKTKSIPVQYSTSESDKKKDKRSSRSEDLVGNFLLSVAIALLTALINQVISNQINWLVVAFAFAIALLLLALHQSRR